MARQIKFDDTLLLKGEKIVIDNGTNDGVIKSRNGTLQIDGNLIVTGDVTSVESEIVTIADNILLINSNVTGTPTEDGGIEIERGTELNKSLLWNETDDKWTVGSESFVAGTFEGNLTGDSAGTHTGAVIGDLTGASAGVHTGAVIGNLTGDVTGTVSSIANHTTSDLAEGSNLYFTDARIDTHLNVSGATANQVLEWTGTDYAWVANSGSSGSHYTDSDVQTLFQSYSFHILPDVDDTIDIGSASKKIRDLYVSENSIHIGNNTLRTSGSNLLLNGEDVMDYANFKNKPTTLAGYGITDGGGIKYPLRVQMYEFNAPFSWVNSGRNDLMPGQANTVNNKTQRVQVSDAQVKYGTHSKIMRYSNNQPQDSTIESYSIIPGAEQYNNHDANQELYGMDTFTQEFWAYFDNNSQDHMQHILTCNIGSSVGQTVNGLNDFELTNYQERYGIFYDPDVGGGRVYHMITNQDNTPNRYVDGFTLNETWVHYAYVRNQDEVKLFINGTLLATIDLLSTEIEYDNNNQKWDFQPYTIEKFGMNNFGTTYINQYRLTLEALYTTNFTPGDLSL
jgi:hypothetical protein